MYDMNIIFAYIAGYLDGDGCFYVGTYIQKPKNIVVFEYNIQCVSIEKETVEYFAEFGGNIQKKPFKEKHKQAYCWTIKTGKAATMAKNIFKFLVDKQNQCKIFIQLADSISANFYKVIGNEKIQQRHYFIKNIREDKMSDLVTKENIEKIKNNKPSIIPTYENFAYLAGLIEAEGCFRIKSWKPKNRPNKVYTISLEIGNTRYPIFPWLIDRFGGNISFSHPIRNKRAVAIWSLQSASLFKLLPEIIKYLRTRKKIICEKLIEFSETILPNGGDRHSDEFNQHMSNVIAKRESIINEIHILNKKGV